MTTDIESQTILAQKKREKKIIGAIECDILKLIMSDVCNSLTSKQIV